MTATRVATALLAFGLLAGCPNAAPPHPNVVLITLDTTRADLFGCYGDKRGLTPNMDAFAAQSSRFDRAFVTAAVTPVSHASILTGLGNQRHGLRVLSAAAGDRLEPEIETLAERLKQAGYQTATIHSAFPVSGHFGLTQGYDLVQSFEAEERPGGGWDVAHLQRRSDETTDRALAWLATTRGPFHLWMHYWDPHDEALLPPQQYLPTPLTLDAQGRPVRNRELYAAELRYLDQEVGRLLAALAQRDALANTLVVIVADHGEGLGDHGWDYHRVLYQEQMRVPLLVHLPGANRSAPIDAVVSTIDIVPTILDVVGLPGADRLEGRSLRGLLQGEPEPPRDAFADQINGYDENARMVEQRPLDDFLYAVVRWPWKLIYRPNHPEASELFDLAVDPDEQHNLFDSQPQPRRALLSALAQHDSWVTAPLRGETESAEAARVQGVLTSLGYGNNTIEGPRRWDWSCATDERWIRPERDQAEPHCLGLTVPRRASSAPSPPSARQAP